MKRSRNVVLGLVPSLVAVACGHTPPPDPCEPSFYSAEACQYAIEHRGYYHDGVFFPHVYPYPMLYYNSGYSTYLSRGGRPTAIGAEHYSPTYRGGGAIGGSAGTVRGGFGGSGAAHASGAGS